MVEGYWIAMHGGRGAEGEQDCWREAEEKDCWGEVEEKDCRVEEKDCGVEDGPI
jgi:hypothetical protein